MPPRCSLGARSVPLRCPFGAPSVPLRYRGGTEGVPKNGDQAFENGDQAFENGDQAFENGDQAFENGGTEGAPRGHRGGTEGAPRRAGWHEAKRKGTPLDFRISIRNHSLRTTFLTQKSWILDFWPADNAPSVLPRCPFGAPSVPLRCPFGAPSVPRGH